MVARFRSTISAFIALAMTTASLTASAAPATGKFPDKPLKLVVPFAAGGFTDILARRFAESMASTLGQPVIVENRAGASGIIGANHVAKSEPDGYTILLETPDTMITAPALMKGVQYKPSDFRQVSLLVQQPLVLVVPSSSSYKSISDLIADAKANPGKITYASWGNGSSAHIASSVLAENGGVSMNHVPYKGVSVALTDVLAGRVDSMYVGMMSSLDYMKQGKLRPIAINRIERSPLLPNVPTLAESGVSAYSIGLWYAMGVPKGTPDQVVEKLYRAAEKAGASSIRDWLNELGMDVPATNPKATEEFMKKEIANWDSAIKQSGISGLSE
ncbi:MAG: tripartite tricarboxylate transporter substrate binding protein [Alcaligenaceae bacterium]|nr:tripartite tricarboxylate transporter substrate binding protein [Alcaligenaceae bacterium]